MALASRLVSGSVFIVFGLGKLVNHAEEVASFQSYGLPSPNGFVYLISVVEIAGGLMLLA